MVHKALGYDFRLTAILLNSNHCKYTFPINRYHHTIRVLKNVESLNAHYFLITWIYFLKSFFTLLYLLVLLFLRYVVKEVLFLSP